MEVIITDHAIKRAKERMRFNKSAITRMASKAFEEGIQHKDTTGKLHKYLDKVYLMEHNSNNMRVYGEFLYLFNDNVLITVYTLNNKLKKLLKGSE